MASALYDKVENITQDNIGRNQDKRALYDRWKKSEIQIQGDRWLFFHADVFPFRGDGEHFSGESISIGYDMDAAWLRVAGIQGE